jgi:dTDP-4-amino-4,6-dideoxygalactose transaminase
MTLRKHPQPHPPVKKQNRLSIIGLSARRVDHELVAAAIEQAVVEGDWGRYSSPTGDKASLYWGDICSCQFVRFCSSGTAAVELALRACRIGSGDEVILAGFDYPGNFRCVEAIGATPVVVDVQKGGWTIDLNCIQQGISAKVRAILASHLYQQLASMADLRSIADQHGLLLIEDACQAPGAHVCGKPAGSWGDVSVFSFGGSKLISCGSGGAVVTNDPRIHQRLKIYCERPSEAFGISPLQAAALLPQFQRLEHWNTLRRERAKQFLAALDADRAQKAPDLQSFLDLASYYKLAWRVAAENRDKILGQLQSVGLPCGVGFPHFGRRSGNRCRIVGCLEESKRAAAETILFDHQVLEQDEATWVKILELLTRLPRRGATSAESPF